MQFGPTRPGVTTHICAYGVANAPKNIPVAYNCLSRVDRVAIVSLIRGLTILTWVGKAVGLLPIPVAFLLSTNTS